MSAARLYRIVATGLAFSLFGLVTLLLSVLVFPVASVLLGRGSRARRWVQRTIHRGCAFFIGLLKTLGLISYEVQGREHLFRPGCLIVANHPSLIDVLFMLAWIPELDCIVKQTLLANPFLGRTVTEAGYIGNATSVGLIYDCAATLRQGRSLIVFPEGTRSIPGFASNFRRGAAHIALLANADIVAVSIRCEPIMLTRGTPWYAVPARRPHYTFSVQEPLPSAQFRRAGQSQTPAAYRLTEHLEQVLALPVSAVEAGDARLQLLPMPKL